MSTDTTGPLKQADGDGNEYIQLVVDAETSWTDGHVMKKKSAAGEAIIRSLAKLQRLCAQKIKNLHCDGAKEQDTKTASTILAAERHLSIKNSTILIAVQCLCRETFPIENASDEDCIAPRQHDTTLLKFRRAGFYRQKQLFPNNERATNATYTSHNNARGRQRHRRKRKPCYFLSIRATRLRNQHRRQDTQAGHAGNRSKIPTAPTARHLPGLAIKTKQNNVSKSLRICCQERAKTK